MPHAHTRLILIDQEQFSADILRTELARKGFGEVRHVADEVSLIAELNAGPADVIVFNYHYEHADGLDICGVAKRLAPEVAIVAVVSAGPAMRRVRDWAKETRHINVVVEKPLSDERFFLLVCDLASARQACREQRARIERLLNIIPAEALSAIERPADKQTELFEAVVLFTDVRRSTTFITQHAPEQYFALLNQTLGAQAQLVEMFQGSVVKFTGDGLLAIFRGMGRHYLALRSALELTRGDRQSPLPYGVGLAHGLVLAGFIGNPDRNGRRQHYDVIGATVHLAARLCNQAEAGELMTTPELLASARLGSLPPRRASTLSIRGFPQDIACVGLRLPDDADRLPE
ncbi:MAG: adenylate/guanylate cyclase domain-containing response regulator [Opitutaceae bacterium]|jgi:adenylate cyclase|nr:adenylate/guanylate cyclase domain-containing response regulator [Opitutaceae bacterium]